MDEFAEMVNRIVNVGIKENNVVVTMAKSIIELEGLCKTLENKVKNLEMTLTNIQKVNTTKQKEIPEVKTIYDSLPIKCVDESQFKIIMELLPEKSEFPGIDEPYDSLIMCKFRNTYGIQTLAKIMNLPVNTTNLMLRSNRHDWYSCYF